MTAAGRWAMNWSRANRLPGLSRRAFNEPRRAPVAVAGLALLGVALGLGGQASAAHGGASPPEGVPAVALSSSWSCAGATAGAGSLAAGRVLVDNAGSVSLAGSLRLVAEDGQARQLAFSVPAARQLSLPETLAGKARGEWAAAFVELYGGMGSVYQKVSTRWGSSVEPCIAQASSKWYFAGGSVLRNATLELSLANPYPAAAVVDVSFATNEGPEQPLGFQGVVVPARGLAVLNVGAALRQRADIATQVTTSSGLVAAFETFRVARPPAGAAALGTPGALNPALASQGVALSAGMQPSSTWWWAAAGEEGRTTEIYQLYNPGSTPARAVLQILPGGKGTGSSHSFTVAPASLAAVTTNGASWALPGVAYSAHVYSSQPLVAEREAIGPGISLAPGTAKASTRWLATPSLHELYSPFGGVVSVYGRPALDLAAGGRGDLTPAPGTPPVISGSSPLVLEGPAVPLRPGS